jgi:predicted metal-dependent enzyme (double-stranded beta helix superfamily)
MDYTIERFMTDAKDLLSSSEDSSPWEAIGERLSALSRRDDLTAYGAQLGPTDASNGTYLLWREPPFFTLLLVRFDEHFRSPVHDHRDHHIVACAYRGIDRWDLYERVDDGGGPGPCTLELVEQVELRSGDSVALTGPPRSIHSHNNVARGDTLELIFSATPPTPASDRLMFDLSTGTCRASWYEIADQLQGDYFPPRPS